jgi:mono/diheme cytochrome c family protein
MSSDAQPQWPKRCSPRSMRVRSWTPIIVLIVGYLASAEQASSVKYVRPENISAAKGSEMFRAYCAACHGTDARGGGPAADSLKKRPSDLTELSRKNNGRFPALRVENVIRGASVVDAHGSRDMPIWGSVFRTLGDEGTVKLRINNLSTYLESLQRH